MIGRPTRSVSLEAKTLRYKPCRMIQEPCRDLDTKTQDMLTIDYGLYRMSDVLKVGAVVLNDQ